MKSLVKTLFGTLDPWGKVWVYVGIVTLFAAAGMSFMVGWKMTALHALFLACLSFVTAFLPMAAEALWQQGRKIVAIAAALVSIPLFAVEFGQHAAYTAGIRGHDLAETKVQNAKWNGAQDSTAEEKATYDLMAKRFSQLNAENGWAATVTADAERAKLPGLDLAIAQESKRGGCGPLCLQRTQERDATNARIAILEERTGLQQKLEATRAYLDKKREKADNTERKSSQTEHMNAFLSKAVALLGQGTLKPSEMTEESTQLSANLAMALAGTTLPAIAFFMAGLYRRKDDEPKQPEIKTLYPVEFVPQRQPIKAPIVVQRQDDVWAAINNALNNKRIAA